MQIPRSPFIRLLIVFIMVLIVVYMPAREFFKITFMVGIPFIFILGFMVKKSKYSVPWILSLLGLILILGGYGYLLTGLPDRIEVRSIISGGAALVAEGKYDAAIKEYKQLENLGRKDKMEKAIVKAENEKKGSELLNQAGNLIKAGKVEQARKVISTIPADTRAAREAKKLYESRGD